MNMKKMNKKNDISVGSRIFEVTGSSDHTPVYDNLQNRQLRKRLGRVSAVASPMLKLDPSFLSKIEIFRSRGHTLFSEVTSFYQRGRGSALRGKWVISSQIGRGGGAYLACKD